jgi:heptosyltransferase II
VTYTIKSKPWGEKELPRKILAIRLQALGDTIITLPYLNDLKKKHPGLTLHFLTRKEVSAIPQSINIFEKVITLGGARNARLQFVLLLFKLPALWLERYDVIIDLQNNRISRFARMFLFPKSYAEFDKSSPISAGERTRLTIEASGLGRSEILTSFPLKHGILSSFSVDENDINIILNPAGYCVSRNWPLENYIEFSRLWKEKVNRRSKFILLLMPSHAEKAGQLKSGIGDECIDLTGRASQVEAFQIISQCSLMITEDSGLMHMSWVQGVPTVALFSSSRKDWSAPQGPNSICLDSSDLECGPCQLEQCKFGNNACLTRYSPSYLVDICIKLLGLKP